MVLDGLDVESESWAYDAGVLAIDLENYRRLPRVVKSTAKFQQKSIEI